MGLVGILRCRRMRYLAHELRADPGDLARRDILRHYEMAHVRKWFTVEGDLMMDAPAANTTEQLVYMAGGSGTQEDERKIGGGGRDGQKISSRRRTEKG